MAPEFRLDQRMTQTLVMTPRLQQAIKLLQYNHIEMVAHVQEAMLENPTLEAVPDSDGDSGAEGERKLRDDIQKTESDGRDEGSPDDGGIDWEKFIEQMGNQRTSSTPSGGTIHDDLPPIETNLSYGESLADHLHFQLTMMKAGDDEARVAREIIDNLDHRGYLDVSNDELAAATGVDLEVVQEGLDIVRSLDPLGCGARDLSECLIIQARQRFPEDPTFERILAEHLHHLERRNYPAIARDLGLEVEDVIEYHRMIQELEPLPGRGFATEEPRYITPDLYVVQRSSGEWEVVVNEEGLPELRISRYYQKVLREASKEDKEYLLDKLRGAEFLIKSINKRRTTIRRVMESIVKFQREFFDHGVESLRPLVLQDVADEVGVHMSTVSRVTTNKYVHTPHGIFELKFFFSAGVRQNTGVDMAAEAIKNKIRVLVTDESKKRPLSDQAIANKLKEDGIRIARRTVAKYREAMGILPSSQRKQMF